MAKITYEDKVALDEQAEIPAINKISDADMNEIKDVVNENNPIGEIKIWSTSTAPTGFLLCDGTAVSRTTYADLFGVIGTTYGVGDNSTTFNVPNLKGKVVVGVSGTETEFDVLGETGGTKEVTLNETMIPAHKHSNTHYLVSGDASGYRVYEDTIKNGTGTPEAYLATADTGNTGGGLAHNNLQPYMALNYIIKF